MFRVKGKNNAIANVTVKDDVVRAAREFAPAGLDAALITAGGEVAERALAAVREGGRIAYVTDVVSSSDNPVVQRLLGVTPEGADPFDSGLGLEPDWVVTMIGAVGNYGEIYERNLGAGTPFELERGLNSLWTDGGLLYAPPYR